MSEESGYKCAVRAWAMEHHLPDAALERWLGLDHNDALAILGVARDLRLRTGQMLSALEMLAEISLRERESIAEVLARKELRAALRGGGSRPERARALIEKLRELRYPRLSRTRAKLQAAVAAMRLPPGLTVVLPRDLGSDELTVRLTAHSTAELEKLIMAITERREQLKAVMEALGGADEI